jgi:hypothetical protein
MRRALRTLSRYGSVTLALADVDGNGTLDLYVANNRTDDIRDRGELDLRLVKGQLTVPPSLTNRLVVINGKVMEYGEPDVLYLNDGKGHFRQVSWTGGAFLDEEGKIWRIRLGLGTDSSVSRPERTVTGPLRLQLYWTGSIWMNDATDACGGGNRVSGRAASVRWVDVADDARGTWTFSSRHAQRTCRQATVTHPPIASPLGDDNRPQVLYAIPEPRRRAMPEGSADCPLQNGHGHRIDIDLAVMDLLII